MFRFLRHRKTRQTSTLNTTSNKRLRLEPLEQKNLLAGDVAVSLVGGDLFITGDAGDNLVQVTHNDSLASPSIGEVSIEGLFGTTINGGASLDYSVTGNIYVDLSAGGANGISFGEDVFFSPDPLELPGDIIVDGGVGEESVGFNNVILQGNVALTDSLGGQGSALSLLETTVQGDVTHETASVLSDIVLTRATVGGDVTLVSEGAGLVQSVLEATDSSIGDDLKFVSDAASAETSFRSVAVGDDVLLYSGDGDDSINFELGSSAAVNTIGDDLRIKTGGGNDEVILTEFNVGDDLVFRGGDGDDVLDINILDTGNIVGDDLYVTGGDGNDELVVSFVQVGDKLRVSAGAGDDAINAESLTVGRSAVLSAGSGTNEVDVTELTGARSLTVLGRGENTVTLSDITTSHFVTVMTSRGDDTVAMFNINTHTVWIATHAGIDDVTIAESEMAYLFNGVFVCFAW